MTKLGEDEWIARYRPLPAPVQGAGFDFGDGDTLIDGTHPEEVRALLAADDACVWTIVDSDRGGSPVVLSGRHLVNRIGHVLTAEPCPEGETIEVELD